MDEVIKVHGLQEVQRALYDYSQQLGDRVVYGALRQGAAVLRKAVQDRVPVRTGNLKRGFVVRRSKIHRGQLSTDLLGVYVTLRKGKGAPFYGRFQNDGWQAGKTRVPGKHFVQDAFEASKNNAVEVIIASAESAAELLARKVGL